MTIQYQFQALHIIFYFKEVVIKICVGIKTKEEKKKITKLV